MRRHRRPARPGFTLIELLAAISIVALLIGLLLPVLASARHRGMSAVCGSHQRQVLVGIHNYYVSQRHFPKLTHLHDATPPFQTDAQLHVPTYLSAAVWHATAGVSEFVNFGVIWRAGVYDSPRVFYCPAMSNPVFQYDTPQNPWAFPAVGHPVTYGDGWKFWNDVFTGYTRRLGLSNLEFDKLRPGTAVIADLNMAPVYTRLHHHAQGFNYATIDGAVTWTGDAWFRDDASFEDTPSHNSYDFARHALKAFRRLDRAGVPDEWWK